MKLNQVKRNGKLCAVVESDELVIRDAQSALELLMRAKYEADTSNLMIDKRLIVEDFFVLSTGLAGEILQKYVNYGGRVAIYGDYSHYTSKPLKDFLYILHHHYPDCHFHCYQEHQSGSQHCSPYISHH